ncbi:MAG: phage tail protein, partial [Candidatus Accumulibacter sp.]|nr:phage tail protein [Accumulibacter sp.]
MKQKYFAQQFAFAGEKKPVPDALQTDGTISFNQGWGYDYERDPATDPLGKTVDREDMNYLFGVVTENLKQYQENGIPEFITPENNGNTPFVYGYGAMVLYREDEGDEFIPYISISDNNIYTPTEVSKWIPLSKIISQSQGNRNRGTVINAFTPQSNAYAIATVIIRNSGSGYEVGNALIVPSDLLDAILIVTSVNAGGAITGISISKSGSFKNDIAGTGIAILGGQGTGATADLTTFTEEATTLNSIVDPVQNDTAIVLQDEIHGSIAYEWGYFDYNGDGIANWVPIAPNSNSDRDFLINPITRPELAVDIGLIPVGMIMDFTGSVAPPNWIAAVGELINRADWPEFWAHAENSNMIVSDTQWLGDPVNQGKFSTGNGSTTFRLPDLRAEFRRGLDQGRGVDLSRNLGSWQEASAAPGASMMP